MHPLRWFVIGTARHVREVVTARIHLNLQVVVDGKMCGQSLASFGSILWTLTTTTIFTFMSASGEILASEAGKKSTLGIHALRATYLCPWTSIAQDGQIDTVLSQNLTPAFLEIHHVYSYQQNA
jgi:hypothetical protein